MKKAIYILITLIILLSFASCMSAPAPKAATLEKVTWQELADQNKMESNANRYVTFETQFLGTDIKALPFQALYPEIANVILMNHTEPGKPYNEKVVTSLDSFLIGLPQNDGANKLMSESKPGDIIKIVGRTEFVNAGFGLFKHLLVRVESFENLGQ